jgi:hypothetical protein
LKAVWSGGFVHDHLNDLLCIPFWVPIMLFAQRQLGLRDDASPRPAELAIPLVVWSWVFEILLPETGWLGAACTADYLDILYYVLGTLVAGLFWKAWYSGGVDERGAAGVGCSMGASHH